MIGTFLRLLLLIVLCGCSSDFEMKGGSGMQNLAGEYGRSELSGVFELYIRENGEFELYEVDLTAGTQRSISGYWVFENGFLKLHSPKDEDDTAVFLYKMKGRKEFLIPAEIVDTIDYLNVDDSRFFIKDDY